MRDLEHRIEVWRKGLNVSREHLEELEGHLRDAIDAKLKDGKPAKEAFELAVAELGATDKISAEYGKMEPGIWWPVRAALWGTITLAGMLSLVYVSILMPKIAPEYGSLRWLLAPHVVAVIFGYTLTYLLGGLGICFAAQRFFGELSSNQARSLNNAMFGFSLVATLFTIIGLVLGMIWAHYAWGRFWRWDLKETGAAALVLWQIGFLIFQKSRFALIERTMLLSIIGNIVVSAAWFGGSPVTILLTLFLLHVAVIAAFSARCKATAT